MKQLLIFCLLLTVNCSLLIAQEKTRAQLHTEVETQIPSNIDHAITALNVRNVCEDQLNNTCIYNNVTRSGLQGLIGSASCENKAMYQVSDAVSGSKVIVVFGTGSTTISGICFNLTDDYFGHYNISTDVCTRLQEADSSFYCTRFRCDSLFGTVAGGSDSPVVVLPPLTQSFASTKKKLGMVNQGTTTTVLHGNASGNAAFSAVVNADITSVAWSKLTSTPTTLSSYGITDAYPLSGNPSGFLTSLTGAVLTSRTLTINGIAHDLSADRSWTITDTPLIAGAGVAISRNILGNTLSTTGGTGWSLIGNSGTTPSTNFLGTTDATSLYFRTNNLWMGKLNSDSGIVAIGTLAGIENSGTNIVAIGQTALQANSNGASDIVAIGNNAGNGNTCAYGEDVYIGTGVGGGTGGFNIAIGQNIYPTNFNNDIILGNNIIPDSGYEFILGDSIYKIHMPLNGGSAGNVLTEDVNHNATWQPTLPYKIYVANITEIDGSTSPTITILQNSLGDIVWTNDGATGLKGTLSGAFGAADGNNVPLKCWFSVSADNNGLNGGTVQPMYEDSDDIGLFGYIGATPTAPWAAYLEIRVYP